MTSAQADRLAAIRPNRRSAFALLLKATTPSERLPQSKDVGAIKMVSSFKIVAVAQETKRQKRTNSRN
jgi:hypothetical protein